MTVYLVGAGPGGAGLLTLRAAEVLRSAEVVVVDRLVSSDVVAMAAAAEVVSVGKSADGPSTEQAGINDLLVDLGRRHGSVVRLKGGDPFLFGRGGEEAMALSAAGVDWEVVPGVSSALSVPALSGFPVTHRSVSASVTVVAGHRAPGNGDVDWGALARVGGTIVVLMGVRRRAAIARSLIEGGMPGSTPVALCRAVGWAEEEVRTTTIALLGSVPAEPPCTIVIGPVVGLSLHGSQARCAVADG